MYRFIYEHGLTEKFEMSLNADDANIYEVGVLFSNFLRAVGFVDGSIRDLFGLEDDEELPVHIEKDY